MAPPAADGVEMGLRMFGFRGAHDPGCGGPEEAGAAFDGAANFDTPNLFAPAAGFEVAAAAAAVFGRCCCCCCWTPLGGRFSSVRFFGTLAFFGVQPADTPGADFVAVADCAADGALIGFGFAAATPRGVHFDAPPGAAPGAAAAADDGVAAAAGDCVVAAAALDADFRVILGRTD